MMSAKSSAKTRAPLAVSGATKLMRKLSVFPSRRKKKSYSELITGDPPASRMMSAKSPAKTRAPLAVSGATKLMRKLSVFPSKRRKKSYSELITGDPPASRMMSAKSSAKTRAPLADSGATKLMRSVDALNMSFVRVDVIFLQTWMDCSPLCATSSMAKLRLCFG